MRGNLFLVSTPIGNLSDMTPRGIEILKKVSLIAAEDTRKTGLLLKHFGIEKKELISYHAHSSPAKREKILGRLESGEEVALVSDAGTPLVSDPGEHLVDSAWKKEIPVIPIPGACAAIAALSVAGFSGTSFRFNGFPPRKEQESLSFLESLKGEKVNHVFYESPHRVLTTLRQIQKADPGARVCFCRELTKLHEEKLRGAVGEVLNELSGRERILGEVVLVVRFSEPEPAQEGGPTSLSSLNEADLLDLARVLSGQAETWSKKDVSRFLHQKLGVSKKAAYALSLGKSPSEAP